MNLNYSTMDDLVEKDALILSKYSILDKLGEGCFGHIYKVKNKKKN